VYARYAEISKKSYRDISKLKTYSIVAVRIDWLASRIGQLQKMKETNTHKSNEEV